MTIQKAFFLATIIPVTAVAQAVPIPVNNGTVDQISWVTGALNQLQDTVGNVFLGNAQTLVNQLGLAALVCAGLYFAYGYAFGHWHVNVSVLFNAMWRYVAVYTMLQYYNNPIPWLGYSFHQLFTAEAQWLAAQVDITILNQFLDFSNHALGLTEKPNYWDLPGVILYFLVLMNMAIVEMALFIVTSFAFWAIGVGIVWGVYACLGLLFRNTTFLFTGWLHYMIKYSMYRVVAAMFVYVWCTVIITFFTQTAHGDYSLGHWGSIILPFMVMNVTAVYFALKIPMIANELISGGAYGGTGPTILSRWF